MNGIKLLLSIVFKLLNSKINNNMNQSKEFRYYQIEADDAIHEDLLINNKCIVKKYFKFVIIKILY